jgi:hypothetical protein
VITRSLEHKKQVPHFLTNPISDAWVVMVFSETLARAMCKAVRMHSSQYGLPCLFRRNSETCFSFVGWNSLGIASCGNDYTASVGGTQSLVIRSDGANGNGASVD